jgi:hypothetical protein
MYISAFTPTQSIGAHISFTFSLNPSCFSVCCPFGFDLPDNPGGKKITEREETAGKRKD